MQNPKSMRVFFHSLENEKLTAKTPDNQLLDFSCTEVQTRELADLSFALREGGVLNLLNINGSEFEFLIFEPDYLIDISSLAECFKPYGAHPLNYSLSRMRNRTITAPILLGNIANFFIDEFVNEDITQPVEFVSTMKKLFRTAAFECTACEDLKNPKQEQEFFRNCYTHFKNIRYAVQHFFPKADIDKDKIVLEPSFISNVLGLQGRLDIMLCDFTKFIELKSGKAVEDFRSGGTFIHSAENHYMQMILYLVVLEFNLNLPSDAVDSYLLYSKYPLLSKEKHSRTQLQKALMLRNQIVAREFILHQQNDIATADALLSGISSEQLNSAQLTGKFFDNYLAPSIDQFPQAFSALNE
ncbi:MAG: DNA helicase, partial [Candidatus Symbiothrix sp.]|nr:DNA helicase [Candidatus Symbiothrix sp.]